MGVSTLCPVRRLRLRMGWRPNENGADTPGVLIINRPYRSSIERIELAHLGYLSPVLYSDPP
jgi:hypothetical protein